jgi:molecular chaperone GrpE
VIFLPLGKVSYAAYIRAMSESEQNQERAELADEITSPDASTAALEAQAAQLKEQLLRALADAENTRKRAIKEREDTAKYAVANFAKDMLAVSDNLQRALQAAPKDTQDAGLKNLLVGVEATERQLAATLERFGIKRLDPLGQPFDPNFHRVMLEMDDAEKPSGTVVQVLQAGYAIHDRLLREALVAVSKGGPAAKMDQTA